eukprot:444806_1
MFISHNNYYNKWTKEPGLEDTDDFLVFQVEPILVNDHEFALTSQTLPNYGKDITYNLYKYNTTKQEWSEWISKRIPITTSTTRIKPSKLSFDAKQECVYIASQWETNEIRRITMDPEIITHISLPSTTVGSTVNNSYFIELMFNIGSDLHVFCTTFGSVHRIYHFIRKSDTNTIKLIKVIDNSKIWYPSCRSGCKFLYLKSIQTVLTIHEHKYDMHAYNLHTFEWNTYMQLPRMCGLTCSLSTDEQFLIMFAYGTQLILNLNTKELFTFHIDLPNVSTIKQELQQEENDGCPVHNNGKHIIYRLLHPTDSWSDVACMKMICSKCNDAQLSAITFTTSRINLCTIITPNVKRGNLLSVGYIRNLWKAPSFKQMLFPPPCLTNIISSYCDSQCDVHLLESNGTHWKIALDEILTIKKKFGTLIESVH